MKIVNESKMVMGRGIQPEGDVACSLACAIACMIGGGLMVANGTVFYFG